MKIKIESIDSKGNNNSTKLRSKKRAFEKQEQWEPVKAKTLRQEVLVEWTEQEQNEQEQTQWRFQWIDIQEIIYLWFASL